MSFWRSDKRSAVGPIESHETTLQMKLCTGIITSTLSQINQEGRFITGVTNDLVKRVGQHKNKEIPGFTARYNLDKLVFYETFEDIYEAIKREKQIKNMVRRKKIELIESKNPGWKDLYNDLF